MKQKIFSWIYDKKYWFQLLSHYLINNSNLTKFQKDEVYNILLNEYQMKNYHFEEVDFNFEINDFDNTDSNYPYYLQSVKNIYGVNALHNKKSKMILDRNLTIVYGENGSGKSGFSRLCNLVFKSQGDSEILPDIYNDSDSSLISAEFTFKNSDNNKIDLKYPDHKNDKQFSQTSVFDSTSSYKDVSEENEMTILPLEFDYFEKIISAISEIRERLNSEIKDKFKENNFVEYFSKGTEIYNAIVDLDEHLNYEKLKELSDVSEKEDIEYKGTKQKRIELEALNVEEKSKLLHKNTYSIQKLQKSILDIQYQLNNDTVKDLIMLEQDIINLERASNEEGINVFANDNISRLGSEEWLSFIKSFNNYAKKINFNADVCVLCGQPIEDKEIFDKYIKYIESTIEENLDSSKKKMDQLLNKVESININMINDDQKIYDWMMENCNGLLDILLKYQRNKIEGQKQISDYFNSDNENSDKLPENVFNADIPNLSETLIILEKQIDSLNKKENDQEVKNLIAKENEYNDKKILLSKLDDIKKHITNKKWIQSANKIKSIELSTSSITRFSNKLFKEIVNKTYIETFEQECKYLNAGFPIRISTRGSKGSTLSKIIINGASDKEVIACEVLSEGEQRTVSLANFFAENLVDDQNNTIILDDPVSSLDHKRRDKIAKRIVEISNNKQVVVFTHDLVFMSDLQEYAKKLNVPIKLTNVKKISDKSGIFYDKSPFTTLTVDKRIEHFEKEISSLNGTLKKAEENFDPKLVESYIKRAKSMCEELRETWERSVEEILLNKTVLRYRNSVETSRLNKINFDPEAVKMVEEGMTKTSAMVHDISSANGDVYPSVEELEQLVNNFKDYISIVDN